MRGYADVVRDSMAVLFAGLAGDHKGSPLRTRRDILRCDIGLTKYANNVGTRRDMMRRDIGLAKYANNAGMPHNFVRFDDKITNTISAKGSGRTLTEIRGRNRGGIRPQPRSLFPCELFASSVFVVMIHIRPREPR